MSQDYQDSSQHQDPLVQAPAGHPVEQGDATGGIIPYKNGPALMACVEVQAVLRGWPV